MSIWPAGTVCRATVRGVPGMIGMWHDDVHFVTPSLVRFARWHPAWLVADVRPMVVIDPTDAPDEDYGVADLLRIVDRDGKHMEGSPRGRTLQWLATAFERQTELLRMEEPGWGEKVVAHTEDNAERREFVRYTTHADAGLDWNDRIDSYRWADLLYPQPVGGAS